MYIGGRVAALVAQHVEVAVRLLGVYLLTNVIMFIFGCLSTYYFYIIIVGCSSTCLTLLVRRYLSNATCLTLLVQRYLFNVTSQHYLSNATCQHYLSNATCLIRPHAFDVFVVYSVKYNITLPKCLSLRRTRTLDK